MIMREALNSILHQASTRIVMTYQSYTPWAYGKTPKGVTILIVITILTMVIAALLEPLFISILKINGPQEFLGLSWWGLSNYYLWQPVTALFIENNPFGIHFSFLLSLTFNMYFLWLFGSNLAEVYGTGPFLRLYFLSGILASLAALMVMPHAHYYSIIAGIYPSLLGLFVAWAILHRDTQLLLFFLIPLKTKWLLAVVAVLALLVPLSQLDFVNFVYYFVGILVGYLYSTIGWQTKTSFIFLQNIDNFFINLGILLRSKTQRLFSSYKKKENKIVDIKTGQTILDDDAFIDAMLAKISRHGEKSLSWQERERMQKISKKKMTKNH